MPVVSDYTALLGILQSPYASWNAHYGSGAPVFVTFSFTETEDLPVDDSIDLGPHADRKEFEAYSEAFKETFRDALKAITAASGVTFVEVTGRAMINAYGIRNTGEDSYAHFPDSRDYRTSSGDLVMGLDGNPPGADRTRQLIWHEMCHALGLKHPFEGENTLLIDYDTSDHTVMSYNYLVDAVLELGHLDIDALRYLYGNPNDKTGWNWSYDAGTFTVTGAARADVIIGVLGQNWLRGGRGWIRWSAAKMQTNCPAALGLTGFSAFQAMTSCRVAMAKTHSTAATATTRSPGGWATICCPAVVTTIA